LTAKIRPCSNPSCQYCFDDYKTCPGITPVCTLTQAFLFKDGVLRCTDKIAIIQGYGLKAGGNWFSKCEKVFCGDCGTDYTICKSCLPTVSPVYNFDAIQCFDLNSELTTKLRVGVDPESGDAVTILKPCTIPLCTDCRNHYGNCATCEKNSVLINGFCYPRYGLPTGLSGKTLVSDIASNNPYTTCDITNCDICIFASGKQTCYVCKTTTINGVQTTLYPDPSSGDCILASAIQAGYGIDKDTNLIDRCFWPGCTNCAADRTVCLACAGIDPLTGGLYYYDYVTKRCISDLTQIMYRGVDQLAQFRDHQLKLSACSSNMVFCKDNNMLADTTTPSTCSQWPNCNTCTTTSFTQACTMCKGVDYLALGVQNDCVPTPYVNYDNPIGPFTISSTIKILEKCTLAYCAACSTDNSICNSCLGKRTLINGSCSPETPDSKGYNKLATNSMTTSSCLVIGCTLCRNDLKTCEQPCNDPLCSSCPVDRSICAMCFYSTDPTKQAYLYKSKCYTLTSLPLKVGLDTASLRTYKDCSIAICGDCHTNYQKCDVCAKDSDGIPYPTFNGNCVVVNPGFGIDTEFGGVFPCPRGCLRCQADYTICMRCDNDKGYYVYTNPADNRVQCQSATQAPLIKPKYGLDSTNKFWVPCKIANCVECSADFQVCTKCMDGFYLKNIPTTDPQVCLNLDTMPRGLGVDTSSPDIPKVAPCKDPKCLNCATNYQQCQLCDQSLIADVLNGNCLSTTQYSSLTIYGKVTTNSFNQVMPCNQPTQCLDCLDDYMKCKTCLATQFIDEITGICYADKAFPPFYGEVVAPAGSKLLAIAKCENDLCADCIDNYKKCMKCKSIDYFYDTTNYVCYTQPPDGFGLNTQATFRQILPCNGGPICNYCPLNYQICQGCSEGNFFDVDTKTCIAADQVKEGKGKITTSARPEIKTCLSDTTCKNCFNNYMMCTECMEGYYVYKPDGLCYDFNNFKLTTGIVKQPLGQNLLEIADCAVMGCKICKLDYRICDECNTGLYLNTAANTCPQNIDIGLGLKQGTTINEIIACKDSNCIDCKANSLICAACNSATFLGLVEQSCFTSIPTGYGKNLPSSSTSIRTCQQKTECKMCSENFALCTDCNTGWYLFPQLQTCYAKSDFPALQGVVSGSSPAYIAKCEVFACADCKDDYKRCVKCSSSLFYDSTNNACLSIITAGYGMKRGTTINEILPCLNVLCNQCVDDNTICTDCKRGSYLDINRKICLSSIPQGMGEKLETPELDILPCGDTLGCSKCSVDYSICQECNPGYFLEAKTAECYHSQEIPYRYGIDILSSVATIKECLESSCTECRNDYRKCTQCNPAYILDSSTGRCYLLADSLPTGLGVQVTDDGFKVAQACNEIHCISCKHDYASCDRCKDEYSLTLDRKCIKKPDAVKYVPIPEFDKKPNSFVIRIPDKKITPGVLSHLKATANAENGLTITDDNDITMMVHPIGIEVVITPQENFGRADLIVDRRTASTSSTSPTRVLSTSLTPEEQATLDSLSLPMTGPIISNYRSSALSALASFEVYTKIAIALRIIGNVVLPADPHSRAAAFAMDRVFSHLTLAGVQGSESYVISRMAVKVVEQNRRTVIPFLNFDDLQRERYPPGCRPTDNMLVAGVDCDFIFNYGSNTIGLFIIFMATIFLEIFFFLFYRRKSIPALSPALSALLYHYISSIGVPFMLSKLFSVQMELEFYLGVSFSALHQGSAGGLILASILGIVSLSFILVCLSFESELVNSLEQLDSSARDLSVVQVYNLRKPNANSLLWRVCSVMWVDMRAHIGKHAVYYPIVSMIRMFLLGLIVGLLTWTPLTMSIVVVIAETFFLSYAYYKLSFSPRLNLWANLLEFSGPVFNLFFYFFTAISFSPSATKSSAFDTYLFVLLTIFFLLSIIITMVAICVAIWNFVQWIRGKTEYFEPILTLDNANSPEVQTKLETVDMAKMKTTSVFTQENVDEKKEDLNTRINNEVEPNST
jgi:hypothetical protein